LRLAVIAAACVAACLLLAWAKGQQQNAAPKPIDLLKHKIEEIGRGVSADWESTSRALTRARS
jgi:hypothetical protein